MPRFRFRFAELLKVRGHARDLKRRALGGALAAEARLLARREELVEALRQQMTELQELLALGGVDVDRSAARRYHASQIVLQIRGVDEERRVQALRVAAARAELVKADQQVKVLEKLEEQQRDEHRVDEERRTARTLEETWQAGRAVERRSS